MGYFVDVLSLQNSDLLNIRMLLQDNDLRNQRALVSEHGDFGITDGLFQVLDFICLLLDLFFQGEYG